MGEGAPRRPVVKASITASALPSGASTEAKQDIGNTFLDSIDSKTPSLSGGAVPVTATALTSIDNKIPDSVGGRVPVDALPSGDYLDAFSRARVSSPTGIFEFQFTKTIGPMTYEQITNGSGASVAHDSTNRCALMTFSSTGTGGKAYMQSYRFMRYQPGKSGLVLITFNFIETKANCLKFAGYSDGTNGTEFQISGSTLQFVQYSGTTSGNETVTQSNWNLDKLDGTGDSGYTLDITKTQILVIDFQALYVGRVRCGFDIDGKIIWAHQFLHSNRIAYPYTQDANRPVRCGMTCSGTVSTTMLFICASVISEGGSEDPSSRQFCLEASATAGSGTDTFVLAIQPRTTFNGFTNRASITLTEVDFLVTGSNPILYKISMGQALTSTSTANVNTNLSTIDSITGTLSGSPTIIFDQGYVAASNQTKGAFQTGINSRYPITLDAAGAVRVDGRVCVTAQGLGGASAMRCAIKWKEVR